MTGAARLSQPGAREEQAGTARPPLCHGLVRQDYSRTLNDFREKNERKGKEGKGRQRQCRRKGKGRGRNPGPGVGRPKQGQRSGRGSGRPGGCSQGRSPGSESPRGSGALEKQELGEEKGSPLVLVISCNFVQKLSERFLKKFGPALQPQMVPKLGFVSDFVQFRPKVKRTVQKLSESGLSEQIFAKLIQNQLI